MTTTKTKKSASRLRQRVVDVRGPIFIKGKHSSQTPQLLVLRHDAHGQRPVLCVHIEIKGAGPMCFPSNLKNIRSNFKVIKSKTKRF